MQRHTISLSSETTTRNTNTDVELVVAGEAQEEDGLENLQTEGLVGHGLNRLTVDLDEARASLAVSNGDGSFLHDEKKVDGGFIRFRLIVTLFNDSFLFG